VDKPHRRSKPTLQSSWNPKRQEVTYRLSKEGLKNVFLLLGAEDLKDLRALIDLAIKGHHDRAAG
jgi:hypothetical protein